MIKEIFNEYDKNFLKIEFMPGNICNYKCSYCFPGSNEGNMPWPDVDIVKRNISHLLDHYIKNGKDTFELFLVGGEPTIWKKLPDLTKFLKSNYEISISISTNGSCSSSWWGKNSQYYDSIDISVHHESADIDHIIQVADTIYEKNTFVVANVLMDPYHFDKCQSNLENLFLSKQQWPIIAKTVTYNGKTFYDDEQRLYFNNSMKRLPNLEWYYSLRSKPARIKKIWIVKEDDQKEQLPNDRWITLNQLNYFKGWQCNLGVDHIKIQPTGEITGGCFQTLYGLTSSFNLYDENFTTKFFPEIKPVICSKDICSCSNEISINKKKI